MFDIYTEIKKLTESKDVRTTVVRLPKIVRQEIMVAAFQQAGKCKTVTEAAYILHNKLTSIPTKICHVCGNEYFGKFYSLNDGYRFHDRCSKKCRANDPKYKEKLAISNIEKNGHPNNMWGDGVRDKTKQKWNKKWGVDNPLKSEEVKAKIKKTNLKKLGVEWPGSSPVSRAKMIQTSIERYGENEKFGYSKARKTSLERYGVPYPMQSPKIQSSLKKYRRKTSTFPSGAKYHYQGYENVAIEKLLESGVHESQIIICNPLKIPVIEYFNPVKRKNCHYFPDVFIPSQNLLIEVKSTWTFRNMLSENMAKHRAAKTLGYKHEIWICTAKKLIEIMH